MVRLPARVLQARLVQPLDHSGGVAGSQSVDHPRRELALGVAVRDVAQPAALAVVRGCEGLHNEA